MTKITYLGPCESVRLPDGTLAERDATVDVDSDLADRLLEQSDTFTTTGPKKKKAPVKKKSPSKKEG